MTDSDPLDPTLKFEAVPYRAEGGVAPAGLALAFALSIGAGLLVGALVGWVGQWFYLIVLFPLGVALAVGFCGAYGVQIGKLRNGPLAMAAGIAGGCVAMAAMHYVDFARALVEMNKAVPGVLDLRFSPTAFAEFVDARAQQGVQIAGRPGQSAMNLGYIGSYIYWGLEILLVTWCAGYIVAGTAAEPFCSRCGTWKTTTPLGRVNVPRDQALQAIVSGEVTRLARHEVGPGAGVLHLDVAACPNCGAEGSVDLTFKEITVNEKGHEVVVDLAHVTYPGESLASLEAMFGEDFQPVTVQDGAFSAAPLTSKRISGELDRIALTPTDKERKYERWELVLGEEEIILLDSDAQVMAAIARNDAKARLVFPSFWQNVRDLGILMDNGTVAWFEPDKIGIKKIREYLQA